MNTILVTGATGNVGREVITSLLANGYPAASIMAGVRDTSEAAEQFVTAGIQRCNFDFNDQRTFAPALRRCNLLFLLRPPQIADVKKVFVPLIDAAKKAGVGHVVFLSVQGVERSTIIPHHSIEKAIVDSGIPYTFLRPAYFLQNFTTTLRKDLVEKHRIFLPAGKARFTLIDVRDVGRAAAVVLQHPELHHNKAYVLTNNEALNFEEMAAILSRATGRAVRYHSPSLLRFIFEKKREGLDLSFILVMILLHYVPRFQQTPPITQDLQLLTGSEGISFESFVRENQNLMM